MAALTEDMQEWLSQYVDVSSGIPSAFTMERVISCIEPTSLELMLQEVAQLFWQKLTDDVIAIDGKTLRGSKDSELALISQMNIFKILVLKEVY